MTDKRGANGAEVVIPISSNEETPRGSVSMDREPFVRGTSEPNSPFKESATAVVPKSAPLSCPSPELPRTPHSAGRPPRPSNENLLRKRSLTRSVYSKPKSRFGEPPPPADASLLEENNLNVQGVAVSSPLRNSLNRGSPNNKSAANITPKTPLMASPGGPADEEDETEIFAKIEASKKKRSRISPLVLVELIIFFCILGCLIASLVVEMTNSGLSTISNTLESFDDEGAEQTDKEITNEMEATLAAYRIFRNVAQPGCKYIDEEDLLRFMIKEEVDLVFPLFEGFETGRIERKALIDWVSRFQKLHELYSQLSDVLEYLENNPQHWHANHNVVVKEIENLNELHMALYPNHTMNFQEWGEKNKRRTELVIAMKRIFEELNIEYNLPLQKVHITSARSDLTKLANI
ncbi:hypothetical protein Tsubulata_028534 [Turnera subulata]|uniref:Uncharacterized protein n=1 Tax=Turnera subulata TaxID=218843 RepID=A0A9Q0FHI5_9ROSI|nr:hypothetical protein Tsubulata_028534 [Turnera subulata]